MTEEQKRQIYRTVAAQLSELLSDNRDAVTAMATCAAVLHEALPQSSWTGFYRVVAPGLLRVGPYQGPVGCLEIPFERGVCGAAASQGRALVVDDVHSFPGHITCDASTKSEIVIPLIDSSENLVAVLDIDSHQPAAFNEIDRAEIEDLVAGLRHQFGSAELVEQARLSPAAPIAPTASTLEPPVIAESEAPPE